MEFFYKKIQLFIRRFFKKTAIPHKQHVQIAPSEPVMNIYIGSVNNYPADADGYSLLAFFH